MLSTARGHPLSTYALGVGGGYHQKRIFVYRGKGVVAAIAYVRF